MPDITIREVRPEDREAVLAFCAHTWENGDYIEYVWDRWLADPAGCFLTALSDERPVGIIHLQMLTATEAWHEGMRVDPAYRRQGIARRLSLESAAEAMRRGATSLRLMTASTNEASITMVEGMHFEREGVMAPYTALPLTSIPRSNASQDMLTLATAADADEIIEYLNLSNTFPAVGGLYYLGYTAYRISDRLLNARIEAGQVYLLRRWERLDGLAIAEPRAGETKKRLMLGYIDGTTESISLMAYLLRQKLTTLGLDEIFANVPDLIMVRDAFTGAEYDWHGDLYYTYGRSLV